MEEKKVRKSRLFNDPPPPPAETDSSLRSYTGPSEEFVREGRCVALMANIEEMIHEISQIEGIPTSYIEELKQDIKTQLEMCKNPGYELSPFRNPPFFKNKADREKYIELRRKLLGLFDELVKLQ